MFSHQVCGLDHFSPRKFSGTVPELISGSLCVSLCFCYCLGQRVVSCLTFFPRRQCAGRMKAG